MHFRDIPLDQRKFILRFLDGYKEKYGADGEKVKSKARLFVDGSRQLPDYTAESRSPVARMESVMMLVSIAAYRGWEVKNSTWFAATLMLHVSWRFSTNTFAFPGKSPASSLASSITTLTFSVGMEA